MDCSLPGSSVHGIFQARVLEWGAIALLVVIKGKREAETTVPSPGILGAMNGAGEAALFPAEALPGGL